MAESLTFYAGSEDETLGFGEKLARSLGGRGSVHINGDLGAGKTTLCRGILRAMGHEGAVKSPTFTLVEPYETQDYTVFHFDLYRLGDPNELDYIGVDEYFREGSLCLIEWPERARGHLPAHDLAIFLEVSGLEVSGLKVSGLESSGMESSGTNAPRDGRTISVKSNSAHGEKVCRELAKSTKPEKCDAPTTAPE